MWPFTIFVAALTLILALPSLAWGQSVDTSAIAEEVSDQGSYLEFSSSSSLDNAIDEANSNGIGFVWLDNDAETATTESLAESIAYGLDAQNSTLHTVLVVSKASMGVYSFVYNRTQNNGASDASVQYFAQGDQATGLTTFTQTLTGSASSGTSSGSGGGFWTFIIALLGLGGVFVLYRSWKSKRERKARDLAEMEADRAEVKEQLKANADKVIKLGDEVIQSGDNELIDLYDQVCPNGRGIQQLGDIQPVRPDGVHFSEDGADAMAIRLGPQLIELLEATG